MGVTFMSGFSNEKVSVDCIQTKPLVVEEQKHKKLTRKGFISRYTKALVQASNRGTKGEKLSKLGVEVGLFLLDKSFDGERRREKFFIEDLNAFSEKLKDYTGRPSSPTKSSMSEALTLLKKLKLIDYVQGKANKIEKHGKKNGTKIEVISPSVFFNQIQKDNKE
mgnify:CR=1 FL=1